MRCSRDRLSGVLADSDDLAAETDEGYLPALGVDLRG
jgi:hypothetical protein